MNKENKLIVYQTDDGAIALQGDLQNETMWASQREMAQLFNVTPQNITTHIKQVFKDGELEEAATCKDSLQVRQEGKRQVKRKLKVYNLDVMIAVGYRVNSVVGTNFRKWATKTLKQHITQGYTINPRRIARNYDTFLHAVEEVKALAQDQVTVRDLLGQALCLPDEWQGLGQPQGIARTGWDA